MKWGENISEDTGKVCKGSLGSRETSLSYTQGSGHRGEIYDVRPLIDCEITER